MNTYEYLTNEACVDGIDVHEWNFESKNIKGLYCDGNIAINKRLTNIEKTCALAEEVGHDRTSVGNILDMSDVTNCKQERQARLWAYDKLISLDGLIKAYEHGCLNRYEAADYLEVTEEFLQNCVDCYTEKYGTGTQVGNYYIMFIPYLAVMRMM